MDVAGKGEAGEFQLVLHSSMISVKVPCCVNLCVTSSVPWQPFV